MCKRSVDMCLIKSVAIIANCIILFVAVCSTVKSVSVYNQFMRWDPILQYANICKLPLIGTIMFSLSILITIYGFISLFANGFGMLVFYTIFLFVHGVFFFAMGFYTYISTVENERTNYYRYIVDESVNVTHKEPLANALNYMQIDLECCGLVHGKFQFYNENKPMPPSCCRNQEEICAADDIWPNNCIDSLEQYSYNCFRWIYLLEFGFFAFSFTVGGIAYMHAMAVKQFFYY